MSKKKKASVERRPDGPRERRRKRRRAEARVRLPAAELWPEDGVDPRIWIGKVEGETRRRRGRKARQLCRQIHEALALLLPADLGLAVASVTPTSSAARVMVLLRPEGGIDRAVASVRLEALAGWLRSEVAGSVQRRKAPELLFCVLASAGGP